ncbi:MAG: hypothetical protein ACRDFX_14385, partial [Chloroflexota bacterium]
MNRAVQPVHYAMGSPAGSVQQPQTLVSQFARAVRFPAAVDESAINDCASTLRSCDLAPEAYNLALATLAATLYAGRDMDLPVVLPAVAEVLARDHLSKRTYRLAAELLRYLC